MYYCILYIYTTTVVILLKAIQIDDTIYVYQSYICDTVMRIIYLILNVYNEFKYFVIYYNLTGLRYHHT